MMKLLRISLLLAALLAAACVNDDKPPVPKPPVNPVDSTHTVIANPANAHEWAYKYLVEWYLWPRDIVAMSHYDATLPFDEFFESMLSANRLDGKGSGEDHYFFSRIYRDDITASLAGIPTSECRTGFDLSVVSVDGGNNAVERLFLVDYVDPTSDAWAKGLRRGTFISAVDGRNLASMDIEAIIDAYLGMFPPSMGGTLSASSMTLKLRRLDADAKFTSLPDLTFATMSDDENPILTARVVEAAGGRKVGYLNYLSFKTGYPNAEDATYHNELKRAMRDFKSAGVSEVVLDLRYNGGGVVATSQLLTSMLAPADKAGKTFSHNTYNANITQKYYPGGTTSRFLRPNEMVDDDIMGAEPGTNLDLDRLYVITSGRTASASELLINALRGVDVTVHLVGEPTLGKTVGMPILRDGWNHAQGGIYTENGVRWRYTMEPIGFSSTNAKGEADYVDGFTPTWPYREMESLRSIAAWKELGDPAERLLGAALEHIATGRWPNAGQRAGRAAGEGAMERLEIPGLRRDRGSLLILPSPSDGAASR